MRLKHLALGLAVATALPIAAVTAHAEEGIYIPLFTYRTGPFAGSGIPIANGMSDYLNMLNERDGGIGGVKLIVEECETGYDTKKGVECYDAVKGKNPAVVNPYSTGITLQLIPKAAVDKISILSMAYGLSASADGNLFPWIFNPPATYWDGASAFIRHVADVEGGFDKLKGKKIGVTSQGSTTYWLVEQLNSAKGWTGDDRAKPVVIGGDPKAGFAGLKTGDIDADDDTWDAIWEETLQVNVVASARLLRDAVRHFRETGGGTIITVSSLAAHRGAGKPGNLAYAASKAAIKCLTQSVARTYAHDRVLAFVIAPGLVHTQMAETFVRSQGGEEKVFSSLPMREWVDPDQLGHLVAFLASGKARHLSGATLDINGASYIR